MAVYNLRWVKTAQYVEDPNNEDLDTRDGFDGARWQLIDGCNNRVLYRHCSRAIYDIPKDDLLIIDAILIDPDGKEFNPRID